MIQALKDYWGEWSITRITQAIAFVIAIAFAWFGQTDVATYLFAYSGLALVGNKVENCIAVWKENSEMSLTEKVTAILEQLTTKLNNATSDK